MATTTDTTTRDRHFIGGEWISPAQADDALVVINPATEEPLGSVPQGSAADVDAAVAAAQACATEWSQVPPAQRAELCVAVGAVLEARGDELAALISSEMGMPVTQSRMIQVGLPIMTLSSQPENVQHTAWEEEVGNSLVVRDAAGVVGAITPWNYPLHQIAAKVAPAVTAGCPVVLKPSEVVPLNAFVLAEAFEQVGAPAGLLNIVTGTGPVVGAAISAHPGIDMVSFTGSTVAGRAVSAAAAQTVKRVALELGGKSANVLLDDADLMRAVPDGLKKCFLNSGQTCSALTRMLVPRARLAEVEAIVAAAIEHFPVGDPFDEATVLGPLVSEVQRGRVREHIQRGVSEGARLVVGGADAPDGLDRGWYVSPTVFSDVDNAMSIAQNEIFGPVLVVIPYDDEDDAVRIANDSSYGLAGGVWSASEERAIRVARRIRTGQVEINGGAFNPFAPFGGVKQSGHGRELGRFGLEEFLSVKALQR